MRYEYFKIVKPAHVQALLDGDLYMNTLEYFRKIEGNAAQQDPFEGICGTIRKDQLGQLGFHYSEAFLRNVGEHVTLISDYYGFNHLFCLYRLQIDEDAKTLQRPSKQLIDFNDKDESEKVVVWIKNSDEFLRRLDQALHCALKERGLEYGIYGGIKYSSAWNSADGPGTRSAFHKEPSYAYQEEWRLCILRREWDEKPYPFPIGSLRDICETISLDRFLNQTDTLFPGFTLVEHRERTSLETYQMFGKINAVSHLMYSYMPQPPKKLNRSDQAEADWHYTQFLSLSGHEEDIDPYLESCLQKYQDLDHMDLLVQYRLSKALWIKATDTFAFMLENAPERVKEDPARYFFPLHTILMQNGEAADAAKFLEVASTQYGLLGETAKIMRSDCLFALGFYDQVIEIFEEMQQETQDPIVEYDLAVSNFYLLHFEKAEEHLKNFEQYFSNSQEFAHKAGDLQRLIQCFRCHRPLDELTQEHPLLGLEWTEQVENTMLRAQASGMHLYLSIDSLYQTEIAQKWDLLSQIPVVEIATLTIVRVVELYRSTGAPVFYHMIEHIAAQGNITITSPELKYYLAIDTECPDLPSHYKMEQALLVQEHIWEMGENGRIT